MSITSELFNLGARVESIIWIPGAVADCEGLPQVFEDFVESDLPEKESDPLFSMLPALQPFISGDEFSEPADVAEALRFTPGFLVQAATPVKEPLSGVPEAYASSWGYYHTAWLYAPDEGAILTVVSAWAERMSERDGVRRASLADANSNHSGETP